ncbi:agmatinase [Aetokthonos hydrillicola Thurmond2011]|uniref:Agmatinase n=1 Tax=Aetokthonos hydrillicola Thurmond2011 TaxID=2712845 RepID=A0AAP5IG43_9CYAN|nr:agmatinase [Aetokthonos hydrillicola]MBO3459760.1 agmatinase [Aetokthonos hydrillicola CCALA 1050]MBW4585193.1 agmatinase [Aetokthonos hydrillicola CCALA 1050]MDR9899532.1 agmatinase [Aetokthonos hydrillicola Thurmond2011]
MQISQPAIPFGGCFKTVSETQIDSQLVFVGLPDEQQSSYRRGCAKGPKRIREAYDGYCYNSTTESGIDLTAAVVDLGDWLPQGCWELTQKSYYSGAQSLFRAGKIPFFAGGDHAVTIAIGQALDVLDEPIHIVQIDAHPDLYPQLDDNPYSHGCVAARLLEFKHIASITQIGIRTMNSIQNQQAQRFSDRFHLVLARDLPEQLERLPHLTEGAPVYLTIDLDGFDPAFAPGVSHPVPGGLTSRQVLNFIQRSQWNLVGMDVVELNPEQDVNDQTAILAARLLHEGMGYAMQQSSRPWKSQNVHTV